MRKFLIPLAVSLAVCAPAIAQDAQDALSPEDQAFEQLLNQYATISLGLGIDERCRQLYPKAAELFAENHAIIKSFMAAIIAPDAFEQLNTGISEAAKDEVANPCGPYTFDFIQASAQISSTMAYRIQVLQGEAEPEPDMTVPAVSPPPAAEEAAAEPQETTAEPVQEPAQEPAQEPVKEAVPPPQVQEPVQETVKEPVQEAVPPPQVQEVKTEPAPSGPVPGETKKEMKLRQREELRVLNRKHREERNNFKANQASYPDPKAARKALSSRQDEEYYALLERHKAEQKAAKDK